MNSMIDMVPDSIGPYRVNYTELGETVSSILDLELLIVELMQADAGRCTEIIVELRYCENCNKESV